MGLAARHWLHQFGNNLPFICSRRGSEGATSHSGDPEQIAVDQHRHDGDQQPAQKQGESRACAEGGERPEHKADKGHDQCGGHAPRLSLLWRGTVTTPTDHWVR